jgi:hypothetical protein
LNREDRRALKRHRLITREAVEQAATLVIGAHATPALVESLLRQGPPTSAPKVTALPPHLA